MNKFFPHKAVDQESLLPSKAERIFSRIGGLALVPAVAMQMIGAAPLNAVRDLGFGAVGGAIDSFFELFRGIVSAAVPFAASWADTLPVAVSQGAYLGALTP